METGRKGEREIFELASSKQQRLFSRCALASASYCRINNGSAGLDEQPSIWPIYQPVVEWLRTFNQKRKMEQGKGERSCPLFSGKPPPVI
ncbi:conserved hypothetical protein [Ricinus communis]|uniref:Uncharacterized protein n=1 Tax=Ricinus communis TaxID=3988 RepID=B9TAA2_RICCO|nr:conserved hypothetical protein [Ricinus communis]